MSRLTPEEQRRKKELQEKLQTRVLTVPEGNELRTILEKEKQQADATGNAIAALGAVFLIGLVIAYLSGKK